MDWAEYYPAFVSAESNLEPPSELAIAPDVSSCLNRLTRQVEVADIGCGFGGLLVALAPKLPDTLLLGMISNSP